MHWLLTTHVRRYHKHYQSSGHVWQGRFKAFPVQDDGHLTTMVRYAERNPLRANLVKRAEDWRWSSISADRTGHPPPGKHHPRPPLRQRNLADPNRGGTGPGIEPEPKGPAEEGEGGAVMLNVPFSSFRPIDRDLFKKWWG